MRRSFLAVVMILSLGLAANAQTFRGAINGTVTDPSGSSVPNATVKATESATGIDHTTATTSDGAFAFQDIPLGQYKVTIKLQRQASRLMWWTRSKYRLALSTH